MSGGSSASQPRNLQYQRALLVDLLNLGASLVIAINYMSLYRLNTPAVPTLGTFFAASPLPTAIIKHTAHNIGHEVGAGEQVTVGEIIYRMVLNLVVSLIAFNRGQHYTLVVIVAVITVV